MAPGLYLLTSQNPVVLAINKSGTNFAICGSSLTKFTRRTFGEAVTRKSRRPYLISKKHKKPYPRWSLVKSL